MTQKPRYMVSINEPEEAGGALVFTFVPKEPSEGVDQGSAPKRVPQFIIEVRQGTGRPELKWLETSDDPGAAKEDIKTEIIARMADRNAWIQRVESLVQQCEQWAKELHWSTRRVEKKLEDVRIGKHRVPALLMQEDTCRVLLEPVGRSAPGAEGVVDLYLMPAYDDIASIYYYADRWNLHYSFSGSMPVATVREAPAMPLTKETLEKVLAELRQNAA
jgi:hypothetical protein